nr:MAG TPA: hypothetical protein [Caudoviricetes sp.]
MDRPLLGAVAVRRGRSGACRRLPAAGRQAQKAHRAGGCPASGPAGHSARPPVRPLQRVSGRGRDRRAGAAEPRLRLQRLPRAGRQRHRHAAVPPGAGPAHPHRKGVTRPQGTPAAAGSVRGRSFTEDLLKKA